MGIWFRRRAQSCRISITKKKKGRPFTENVHASPSIFIDFSLPCCVSNCPQIKLQVFLFMRQMVCTVSAWLPVPNVGGPWEIDEQTLGRFNKLSIFYFSARPACVRTWIGNSTGASNANQIFLETFFFSNKFQIILNFLFKVNICWRNWMWAYDDVWSK